MIDTDQSDKKKQQSSAAEVHTEFVKCAHAFILYIYIYI